MIHHLWSLAFRALNALPADPAPIATCKSDKDSKCRPVGNPLGPSKEVELPGGLQRGIETGLGYLQFFAWIVVVVAVFGVGVTLVWSWSTGKPIQAASRITAVFVGALVIGGANGIVTVFGGF